MLLAVGSALLAGSLAAGAVVAPEAPAQAPASKAITVGSVTLAPCGVVAGAFCGHLDRAWDDARPALGTLRVGFAFVPAASGRSRGTVVPHEGGPGYSTTGSAGWFADMYGDLLDDHDMLLVDQRGTGRSAAISCPDLDNGSVSYARAVGRCSRDLGARSGLYGSAASADDLAAVLDALGIRRVDLYGDSYGTFFAQVFAGRHPQRLRTLILDGAYPTYGESAWYPTQAPALRRTLTAVCARSVMCDEGEGRPVELLSRLIGRLRDRPVEVRAPGADGRLHGITLDAPAVAAVAYNGTYLAPTYREFTGAVRAALDGDYRPLGRLYAEYWFTGPVVSDPREYSAGAEAAVSCHDYPQLFDLRASRETRHRQYRDAFIRKQARQPGLYGPFTIAEYRSSGWTSFDMCLRWAKPLPGQDFGPPRPPSGSYPSTPTLVLSGELDTITTAAEGDIVAAQFPDARHIVVSNSMHVVGGVGADSCGARLVRYVVRSGSNEVPEALAACAGEVPPLRSVRSYPLSYRDIPVPPGGPDDTVARVAVTVADTVADLIDRWWQSVADRGLGLRGGRWHYTGDRRIRFSLDAVQLVRDLPVTGTATWDRRSNAVSVDARIPTTAGVRSVVGRWNAEMAGARADVTVRGPGGEREISFLAP